MKEMVVGFREGEREKLADWLRENGKPGEAWFEKLTAYAARIQGCAPREVPFFEFISKEGVPTMMRPPRSAMQVETRSVEMQDPVVESRPATSSTRVTLPPGKPETIYCPPHDCAATVAAMQGHAREMVEKLVPRDHWDPYFRFIASVTSCDTWQAILNHPAPMAMILVETRRYLTNQRRS